MSLHTSYRYQVPGAGCKLQLFRLQNARSCSRRRIALGCFLCGSASKIRFVFFDPKNESICLCSSNMHSMTGFFSISESDDPRRQILAQNPATWAIRFSNRKMAWSLNSICYPRQQAAAERSMSWMVTQLDSDVTSRPMRSRRAARLSVVRLLSVGAGSGLDTKRSTLGAHVSVDRYS